MTPSPTITAVEACHRLKISLDYLYKLIWAGTLPATKIDRHWYVEEEAVQQRIDRLAGGGE